MWWLDYMLVFWLMIMMSMLLGMHFRMASLEHEVLTLNIKLLELMNIDTSDNPERSTWDPSFPPSIAGGPRTSSRPPGSSPSTEGAGPSIARTWSERMSSRAQQRSTGTKSSEEETASSNPSKLLKEFLSNREPT